MALDENIVELRGITKDFPGVRALDNVHLQIKRGEIHALVGENGAGKSTLSKILAGVLRPDGGSILLGGKPIDIHSPRMAQKLGISMVFQELNLAPSLTIAQNLLLAHEPTRWGLLVDHSTLYHESRRVLESVGLRSDPSTLLGELGVAEQQIVALARALSFDPQILILDESTSSLTIREADQLFDILRTFRQKGGTVLYISHRLKEVFQIADRITVLKDGKLVRTCGVSEVDINGLMTLMVGREIQASVRGNADKSEEILRIDHLCCDGSFKDVSLVLHKGEIVGLAGLVGSGRTALAEAVFGARRFQSGQVFLNEMKQINVTPAKAIRSGLALLPEDRHGSALCMGLSIENNITMASLWKMFPWGLIRPGKEAAAGDKYIRELGISTTSRSKPVRFLSGGNQQKVVLAKWLCSQSRVLIFDEPTRGVDVGAKAEIHRLMNELTAAGAGILMISSEMPEIVSMSDRVYVMRDGKIVAELTGDDINEERILERMLRGQS